MPHKSEIFIDIAELSDANMDYGDVCIIIPNLNGQGLLERCLDSIQENTFYSNFDIVVVDNGSSDGSISLVISSYPKVKIIKNDRNLGFSIANNQALYQYPDYDWYLLLNNDTEVHKEWLTAMLTTANQKDSIGIVGSKLLYPDGTIQHAGGRSPTDERGFFIGNGKPQECFTEDRPIEYASGAAFLIDRDVVADIGYLDEMFSPGYFEDSDFCDRATKAGFEVYYSSDAIVTHFDNKTSSEQPSKYRSFIHQKNFTNYILLNESTIKSSVHLYCQLKKLGKSFIRQELSKADMKLFAELLLNSRTIISKRFDRTKHIPSYYCEDIRNYMDRYRRIDL